MVGFRDRIEACRTAVRELPHYRSRRSTWSVRSSPKGRGPGGSRLPFEGLQATIRARCSTHVDPGPRPYPCVWLLRPLACGMLWACESRQPCGRVRRTLKPGCFAPRPPRGGKMSSNGASSENAHLIGRVEVDDLEAILAVSNGDVAETIHTVGEHLNAVFTWDYAKGARPQLSRLYEKAKTGQWNAETDVPWDTEVDQQKVTLGNVLAYGGFMPGINDLKGTPFEKWTANEWIELGCESQNWTLSQFLHGEQGALLCTAKIVETVPWIDAKYYAATQVMDEARHVEVFSCYLDTKLSGHYPINAHLKLLLDQVVRDSRWDMTYLGMQIMVEGLALSAFRTMHDMTVEPLLRQILR